MAQHTINCDCTGDSYVESANPSSNYGSEQLLQTSRLATNTKTIYLKFDIPSIRHKKLISAKVFLYTISGIGYTYIDLAPLRADFDEMALTYNNRPADGISSREYTYPVEANQWTEWKLFAHTNFWDLLLYSKGVAYLAETSGAISFHSRENANKPYLQITYEDSPPLQPTAVYPANAYLSLDEDIALLWEYRAEFGGAQKGYQVEWRAQDDAEWTIAAATSESNGHVVPGGTLSNGNISWRVKTYNEYGEESPYSEILNFYAIGRPGAPSVYVDSSARPLVMWTASQQQVWQLQILEGDNVIYDSGNMPGVNVYSHRPGRYLEDGEYTARVRIRNEYDFWSDWGSYGFEVATVKPTAPCISVASNADYGIRITVAYDTPRCLLYRREVGDDWIWLAGLQGETAYTDYTPASHQRYEYMARAVADDNSFADSPARQGVLLLQCSVLTLGAQTLPLRYRLDRGHHRDYTHSAERVLVNYVGRAYPVVESSGYKSTSLSLNYFVAAKDLPLLLEMADAPVILYRNELGHKMYCSMGMLDYQERFRGRHKGYDATFDLRQVDHKEGI